MAPKKSAKTTATKEKEILPPPRMTIPVPKAKVDKSGMKKKAAGKKRKFESFSSFLYKVLKQVHPDIGISSKAMSVMNSFANDIFERLATESAKLARVNKRPTLSSRDVQTAARLILPGELSKHAVSEGSKAVSKYFASKV